jgi:hypothetical protein
VQRGGDRERIGEQVGEGQFGRTHERRVGLERRMDEFEVVPGRAERVMTQRAQNLRPGDVEQFG